MVQVPDVEPRKLVQVPVIGAKRPSAGPFIILQVRSVVSLYLKIPGLAVRVHVGGMTGLTTTVAEQLFEPSAFVTVSVNVVFIRRGPVVHEPPLEPTKFVQVPLEGANDPSAGPLVIAQLRAAVWPALIGSAGPVSEQVGAAPPPAAAALTRIEIAFEDEEQVSESVAANG